MRKKIILLHPQKVLKPKTNQTIKYACYVCILFEEEKNLQMPPNFSLFVLETPTGLKLKCKIQIHWACRFWAKFEHRWQ